MIKLIAIEPRGANRLHLRFADGASGVYDFSSFIEAGNEMTAPLADPTYFARCFIELGALAWPNGFDLSAESLHRRLDELGQLRRDAEAA
jgi:hypothetical protein